MKVIEMGDAISVDGTLLNVIDTKPADIIFFVEKGRFLTVKPDGEFIFHKENFPQWDADDFAKEFIKCVEEKFTGRFK